MPEQHQQHQQQHQPYVYTRQDIDAVYDSNHAVSAAAHHYGEGYDHDDNSSDLDSHTETTSPDDLFEIIEEGMPRTNEPNHAMTALEVNQRKELIEQTWDRIRKWLWSHQDPLKRAQAVRARGNNEATPLHNVCKLANPPTDIVQALLEANPEPARWTDSHGWLPLHHACANGASGQVLEILCRAYPEGKTLQDTHKRTPLHFYLTQKRDNYINISSGYNSSSSNNNNNINNNNYNNNNNTTTTTTSMMVNSMATNLQFLCDTGAPELADIGGMLPMHYACAYGVGPQVLTVLQEAFPDAIVARENKGRTPMHLAMVNAHRDASPGVIQFLMDNAGNELVNVRDHEGYLPLHLLALGLRGFRADEPQQRTNVSDCLKIYLAAEPTVTADFLTALQDLPDWLQDVAVISQHVRNILNEKIVQRLPTFFMIFDLVMYVVLIVCFYFATKTQIELYFSNETETSPDDMWALIWCLVGGGTWFLFRELLQIISLSLLGSVSSWFYDLYNWLDVLVIVLMYYFSTIMLLSRQEENYVQEVSETDKQVFRYVAAWTQFVLWMAVVSFLRTTIVDFAIFVGGLIYVMKRLAAFFIAVFVFIFMFAQMFYFIYMHTYTCNECNDDVVSEVIPFPHCTWIRSVLKTFTMMMGEIGNEYRYSDDPFAQILYVAYAIIVVILLSNVLIAIVTESYEVVQNDRAAVVFWGNRLDFVTEVDAISYGLKKRLNISSEEYNEMNNNHHHNNNNNNENGDLNHHNNNHNNNNNDLNHHNNENNNNPSAVSGSGGGGGGAPNESAIIIGGCEVGATTVHSAYQNKTLPTSDRVLFKIWKSLMQLFDQNLYDDIASPTNIEFWCYFLFQAVAALFLIPVWILIGFATFGILWPPQIREFLFVSRETTVSRSDIEQQKLLRLKNIQHELKLLSLNLRQEMEADREEMMRMKSEVDATQSDAMADLQQVRELMTTLLDIGRQP